MSGYAVSMEHAKACLESMSLQELDFYRGNPSGLRQYLQSGPCSPQSPTTATTYAPQVFSQYGSYGSLTSAMDYQYLPPKSAARTTPTSQLAYLNDGEYPYMKNPSSSRPYGLSLEASYIKVVPPYKQSPDPHLCLYPECEGLAFVRKGDLQRHVSTIHDPNRTRHPCPIQDCNRTGENGLPRADKVLDHIREKHKLSVPKTKRGDKPFRLIAWLRENGVPLSPEFNGVA